jgi:hypothetical protein
MSKMSMVGPLRGDARNRERPPPMSKMSMAGPLGGDVGNWERPLSMSKMSMVAPWKVMPGTGSAHHLCQRHRWRAP